MRIAPCSGEASTLAAAFEFTEAIDALETALASKAAIWTDRELRLHDALMALTGYVLANFKPANYCNWHQGGGFVVEAARKALEELPPEPGEE